MRLSKDIFQKLDIHWQGDDKGMNRLGYSPEEAKAIHILTTHKDVLALGMRHFRDVAGNHYLVYKGQNSDSGAIMAGSHLDAVPNGGRYDGPSGVLSALEALTLLHGSTTRPYHDICVPIFRCEEGPAFRHATLGSSLAVGRPPTNIMDRDQTFTGKPLRTHMTEVGIDTKALEARIKERAKLIPLGSIVCAVEQHIEQSTTLVNANADVGIVTDLRGYVNWTSPFLFKGQPNHTGTALQEQRQDPVRAAAAYITVVSDQLDVMRDQGADLVFSFPVANTGPLASSCRLAPQCEVRVEARSLDIEHLRTARDTILRNLFSTADRFNQMKVSMGEAVIMPPTQMSHDMITQLEGACKATGVSHIRTISGAVHDTGTLRREGIPATMILTRHGAHNGGQSHWPGEVMGIDDKADPFDPNGSYAAGIKVLAQFFKTANFSGQGRGGNFAQQMAANYSAEEYLP